MTAQAGVRNRDRILARPTAAKKIRQNFPPAPHRGLNAHLSAVLLHRVSQHISDIVRHHPKGPLSWEQLHPPDLFMQLTR